MRFRCTHCQQGINVPDDFTGRVGKCPKCGKQVRVPNSAAKPPPIVKRPEDQPKRRADYPSPPYCWFCIEIPPEMAEAESVYLNVINRQEGKVCERDDARDYVQFRAIRGAQVPRLRFHSQSGRMAQRTLVYSHRHYLLCLGFLGLPGSATVPALLLRIDQSHLAVRRKRCRHLDCPVDSLLGSLRNRRKKLRSGIGNASPVARGQSPERD